MNFTVFIDLKFLGAMLSFFILGYVGIYFADREIVYWVVCTPLSWIFFFLAFCRAHLLYKKIGRGRAGTK